MSIRKTESKLPLDFNAFELGQAVEDGDIALVSYLTSPISIGSKIDYVLFVRNISESDREDWQYNWITKRVSTNEIVKEENGKNEGIFYAKSDFLGDIVTSVEVIHNGDSVTLSMTQEIVPLEPGLEVLLGNNGLLNHLNVDKNIGALGGNEVASRELINNFQHYVKEAIAPIIPKPAIDIPLRFLAAIAYSKINQTSKEGWFERDDELAAAAAELNDEVSLSSFAPKAQFDNGLGVCSITPQTLAMVLERPGTENPFTTWTELPSNEDEREEVRREILENLNTLPDAEDVRIDLFNLLRFPKTNIRMCAMVLRRLIDRAHRWENVSSNDLLEDDEALAIIATEYDIGGTESPLPENVGPPAPTDAEPNDFGAKLVDRIMKIPAIAIYFTDSSSEGALAYGGYDLKRGDDDAQDRWGGEVHTPPAQEIPGQKHYVQELQEDLEKLGFTLVGTPNGKFEMTTEWAVREFQIYAKMPALAEEGTGAGSYIDKLNQVVNILPYTGPLSGAVNVSTRIAIQYWKANQWRCPVVIGAYNTNGSLFNNKENIWKHDELGNCNPDVYARDFTGYYGLSPNDNNLVGMHAAIGNGPVSLRMNTCGHMRTHPQIEVTPEKLVGIATSELLQSYADPQTQEYYSKLKSTYKVVRSIAQAESVGYFDSINAWDTAIISVGMYHWTLGLKKSGVSVQRGEICVDEMCDGEMCAFLALLKFFDEAEFVKYFKYFGIDVDRNWWWVEESGGNINASSSGDTFFMSSLFKYAGWLKRQTETGDFVELERKVNEANYYRNWHWFYRVTMANRHSDIIHRLNWLFTRIRIRDMLQLDWRRQDVPNIVPGTDFKVGDIYTSEKTIALLLRGHVNYPRKICFNGSISHTPASFNVLPQALQNAINGNPALNWNQAPSNWGDSEESVLAEHLLTSLKNMYPAGTVPTFDTVDEFTWEGEDLSEERNSFRFYDDELTSAPDYST